ncbi:MAG: hypothetical protein KDD48_06315 [Bdellovibrionales bacterium]|nr:hypothetical protein [Bdellovibrionales bacterium]
MMNGIQNWLDALINASQNAVNKVILFTPNLIAALILLLIGTMVGRYLCMGVEKLLTKTKISEWIKTLGLDQHLEPFGFKSLPHFLGKLAHLFVVLITVIASADILGLPQVTGLIETILGFIPRAVVALLIVMVGLWGIKISDGFLKGDTIQRFPVLKGLVRFLIMTFALLAALDQFNVSTRMIEILFGGLVFAMALAAGLSFGLGGKEAAKDILDKLKKAK